MPIIQFIMSNVYCKSSQLWKYKIIPHYEKYESLGLSNTNCWIVKKTTEFYYLIMLYYSYIFLNTNKSVGLIGYKVIRKF